MKGKNRKADLHSERPASFRHSRLFLPFFLPVVVATFCLVSCTTVKPYQRVYLNDSEMGGSRAVSGTEEYVQSIREGASGGETGKGSGGCGCN